MTGADTIAQHDLDDLEAFLVAISAFLRAQL